MKIIKNMLIGKAFLAFVSICSLVSSIDAMKPTKKSVSIRKPRQEQVRQVGLENIWVYTSDEQVIKVPKWQIDQMKVLQVLLAHQKEQNNKNNPIKAQMINADNLILMQKALNIASNLEEFTLFCDSLTPDQKTNLINAAFTAEASGLAALLAEEIFSPEIQDKLGATFPTTTGASIIEPVATYLFNHQNISQKVIDVPKDIEDVNYVIFNPDGSFSSYSNLADKAYLWDGATGALINALQTEEDISILRQKSELNMLHAGTSHDGQYIALKGGGNTIKLFDRRIFIKKFAAPQYIFTCITFSFDNKYLASGTKNGALIIWNVATGEQIKILEGHRYRVECASFSRDGKYIVSGSSGDHKLILWNIATGEKKELSGGHEAGINCVTFSPDGQFIISGSNDKLVVLWNARTAQLIKALEGHGNIVQSVAFSPTNKCFASGSYGRPNPLILWTLVDADEINFIKKELNIAQARLLYRLYLAKINNVPVILDKKDPDYRIYMTLPDNVQQLIKTFFPFEEAVVFVKKGTEQAIQEKINEYKTSLAKTGANVADKIKTIKIMMKDFDKNSVDYKACERLLNELESEAAFED